MKKNITFAGVFLVFAFSLVSCGNKSQRLEDNKYEDESQLTITKDENITKDVDIPRSHLGISLGMRWSEAKQVLAKNGWPHLKEEKDDIYNTIIAKPPYGAVNNNNVIKEYKGKYSDFSIVVFDNKVCSINLCPKDNQKDIIDALKQKYPFEDEEIMLGYRYYGNGHVNEEVIHDLTYSNGETEISLRNSSYYIQYKDVKLNKERSAYRDRVEAKSKIAHETEVNQQLSDY